MSYDGRTHTRMATLPGMWDRTLTVTSAGKTFSVTGWKIGASQCNAICLRLRPFALPAFALPCLALQR